MILTIPLTSIALSGDIISYDELYFKFTPCDSTFWIALQ
jgi:hypothetical protein